MSSRKASDDEKKTVRFGQIQLRFSVRGEVLMIFNAENKLFDIRWLGDLIIELLAV